MLVLEKPLKQCRTVKGLVAAIKKGKHAYLEVWGIDKNQFVPGGAYLNLGRNKYASVSKDEWELIKPHIRIRLN